MSQKSRQIRRLQRPATPNKHPLSFTQREVMRCIKAARAMGVPIGKIEVDPATGKIAITTGTPATDNSVNEWDNDDGKAKAQTR